MKTLAEELLTYYQQNEDDFGDLLKLYTNTDKKHFFKGKNSQLYIKKN